MSPSAISENSPDIWDVPADELTQLELQIARRADELIRNQSCNGTQDPWLQAEREVICRTLENAMAAKA